LLETPERHKRIAFLRGQQQSSDSATRWEALEGRGQRIAYLRAPELVMQGLDSTPDLGYPYGKELIKRNVPFTAMVNDISAIGAMKAFAEAKLRIPQDVSLKV
jgi:DNA-binding LacI/PurR family transcriptional regulator